MKPHPARRITKAAGVVVLLALVTYPAFGADGTRLSARAASRLSQGALLKSYLLDPSSAPDHLAARFRAAGVAAAQARAIGPAIGPPFGDRFNGDLYGLPQNEEAVTVCRSNTDYVLGGTNDYRGILNAEFNFTGWHFSDDSGDTLQNEGLLPPADGLASSGDPAFKFDSACNAYASSLAFNVFDPATPGSNGIGVWKSHPLTLDACNTDGEPFETNPLCWPVETLVATNTADHFLDKEWFDVGNTGDGTHVWVSWSDFHFTGPGELDFTAQVFAARCEADLSDCTDPIEISPDSEPDIQFSYPTVGPDGRTYITWAKVEGELEGEPQTFTIEMRVAEPGSTTFGPVREVAVVDEALAFGALLQANSFRIATNPKNTVKLVGGSPRVFVTWDECRARINDGTVCEFPKIFLAYSDDLGVSWTTQVISNGGVNYFPAIANDTTDGKIVVAYFTTKYDPQFHNRQDIELVTINANTGTIVRRQRVTTEDSNEAEADPLFQAEFIGDYIDVAAHGGTAWVHYNMNIRDVRFLGEGAAVGQQDNFLSKLPL